MDVLPCGKQFVFGPPLMSFASTNSTVRHARPPEVTREFVLTKCDYFVDIQLWPIRSDLDIESWLNNFTDTEAEFATHLLNAFMYFSRPVVDQMFVHAIHDLSRLFYVRGEPVARTRARWRGFLDNVILTRVTGEVPSDADSGFIFARMARQLVGIPEERILGPAETLQRLITHGPAPVIFVDDFVGSGNQFIETWERDEEIAGVGSMSFAILSATLRDATFYYCPVIATEKGMHQIKLRCPDVQTNPAHTLSSRYNAFAPDSIIWPEALLPSADAFLQQASKRAGIPPEDMRGFHDLGLTIAFAHGVPDATLPLFYWENNGWKPLVKRT